MPWYSWPRIRLYLWILVLGVFAVLVGMQFTQLAQFWFFGIYQTYTGMVVVVSLVLGLLIGFGTSEWARYRRSKHGSVDSG